MNNDDSDDDDGKTTLAESVEEGNIEVEMEFKSLPNSADEIMNDTNAGEQILAPEELVEHFSSN